VNIFTLLKKKRNEVKVMNIKLKELQDEILQSMVDQGIPSCASSGHTFTVREKCKMKSATAKTFLLQVKDFFHIADDAMDEFVTMVDNKRKSEAEIITALECKTLRKRVEHEEGSGSSGNTIGISPLMSSTIDDMYS